MQIISLNQNLLEQEMKTAGLSPDTVANFCDQERTLYYKLHGIPVGLQDMLKEIFDNSGIASAYYQDSHNDSEPIIMFIAGSVHRLRLAAENLKNSGVEPAAIAAQLSHRMTRLQRPLNLELKLGNTTLALGKRTYIMGILNVTPDSFSDGGKFDRFEKALEHAYQMADEGADIIDIGGESTRPGHQQVTAEEERDRVMPIIKALKKDNSFKLPLSIDTYKALVAEAALDCGIEMLNDVWGLKADPELAAVAARYRVPLCLMHNRNGTDYIDLIADILSELEESVFIALSAGIAEKNILIDPGIGFGKNLQQNLDVMFHLGDFRNLGYPLLLGTSRKSMIGKTLDLPVEERVEGTAATIALGISSGADIIRVHDVKEMKRVAIMTDAMIRR
jgi:dihydropteroate synthase